MTPREAETQQTGAEQGQRSWFGNSRDKRKVIPNYTVKSDIQRLIKFNSENIPARNRKKVARTDHTSTDEFVESNQGAANRGVIRINSDAIAADVDALQADRYRGARNRGDKSRSYLGNRAAIDRLDGIGGRGFYSKRRNYGICNGDTWKLGGYRVFHGQFIKVNGHCGYQACLRASG